MLNFTSIMASPLMSEANPASSCNEIYQRNPTSRGTVDQYWIKTNEGLFQVTCT